MLELTDSGSSSNLGIRSKQERLLPEPEAPELPLRRPRDEADNIDATEYTYVSQEYPTVFEEAKDMLLSAILMYGLVDLRTLARQGLLDAGGTRDDYLIQQLLQLPISAKTVVQLVARYRPQIEQHIGRASTDLYLDAFDAISSTCSSYELELEFTGRGKVSLVDFMVAVVEDEHANVNDRNDGELVYALCVDTARRRITVLFRGCSTRQDWSICANNLLMAHVNPLYEQQQKDDEDDCSSSNDNINNNHHHHPYHHIEQPETIAIHSGYSHYMFNASDQSSGVSKFDAIIGHLQRLLHKYPGYHVYVTGHSLGAALATVFAFQAAATQQLDHTISHNNNNDTKSTATSGSSTGSAFWNDDTTTNNTHNHTPITCINFASPMVGNLSFETAFRQLEACGQLRCLRCTNHFDLFTQLPDRGNWLYVLGCCWTGLHLAYMGWALLFFACFQSRVYRHVGMDLHLYKHQPQWWWSWWRGGGCGSWTTQKGNDHKNHNNKESSGPKYSYKIKHPRGTPDSFAWRVAHDWKKHFKQALQRLLMLPFVVDFNTNHKAQEHLKRLSGLAEELEHVYLKDLYDTMRFPSPRGSAAAADSSSIRSGPSVSPPTTSPIGECSGCFV